MAEPVLSSGEVFLGEVIGVFGLRGEVRLHLHNRGGDTLYEPTEAILVSPTGERRKVRIQARSGAGLRVLGRIDGVTTPEAAAELHGWAVVVPRAALPMTGEGEYYIHDLLGCQVVEQGGEALGEIVDVVAGDRDVWVVETGEGEGFLLAIPENVLDVDLEQGRVVVRPGSVDRGEE